MTSSINLDQLNDLKIQMKKWERNFEKENGRKATKDDIEKDEEIKQNYLVYWKMIKILKKNTENQKQQEDNTWNDSCKKESTIKKVEERKLNGFVSKTKMVNSMLDKLMRNELNNQDKSNQNYSLKRNKNKDKNDENKFIRINSNQISLLKRETNHNQVKDDLINLIQSKDVNLDPTFNLNNGENGEARFTVESPTTLDLESKINQTSNKNDSTSSDLINNCDLNTDIETTEKEIQNELNSIINKLNDDNDFKPINNSLQNNYQSNQYNSINHQLINQPLNELCFNEQKLIPFNSNYDNSNFNQPISQDHHFNQPIQQYQLNQPIQEYQSIQHQPNQPQYQVDQTIQHRQQFMTNEDDVDFGTLMPTLFENFNSSRNQFNNNQQINYNENSNQLNNQSDQYYLISQPQYTDLASSNSASAIDLSNDFSPIKDADKLTFTNVVKNFTNLHCDEMNVEQKDQSTFHVNKLPDVYDFEYEPEDKQINNNNNDKTKKLNVKELTKQKSKKKRAKKEEQNFRRIDMKKKTYSRGHKKINVNRYKRNEWKKLQQENKCFKCGETDHWARDCRNVDQELKQIEQQQDYDELEELAFNEQPLINSAQPLFQDECDNHNLQAAMQNALRDFGYKEFRTNQKEVCERILLGKSCLFISSTGSGKSLCYQLPAYIYFKLRKYITIVVSPLISLMEDQILCLPKCLKAVTLHSGLTDSIKKSNLSKIQNGEVQILFLSPEYILTHLYELSLLPTIGFVCIDEAHCLSEWSNNFRPSYLQFFNVLKNEIKINTFLALTATANKSTAKQILKNIDMSFEADVIGVTKIPNNLILTISRDSDKDFALINLLKSERFNKLNSIIIYCSRRETTEKIATLLRIEMQKSKDTAIDQEWSASAYHAGLSYQERKRIQKSFISGKLRVVVATIAFGMGINKTDVDGIIHFNLPKTVENYVQEIGRSGRDGKQAQCHLFLDHDYSDLFEQQRHIYSNGLDKINVKKLISRLFKPCKCIKLKEELDDQNLNATRCPGHENAFTIKELTEDLDIKEETLLTILIYLELNLTNIKVMNKTNSICVLSCYKGGSEQLEQLAKKYPFIALPLAQSKKDRNDNQDQKTIIRFSYINVASMLGQSSNEILRKLKNLEWKYEQNRRIRSNIRVAFEELSIHVKTPGDLNEQEIEKLIKMVLNFSKSQENLEIKRLKQFHDLLKESSQSKCINKINQTKSLKLRKYLNDYFDLNSTTSYLEEEDHLDNEIILDKLANELIILKQSNNSEIEDARRDIRDLINIHSDQYFTSRSIARILQGISSPKYPVDVWGRDKRFWRKRIKMDFNVLFKLASEELIRIKCGT